MIGVRSGSCLAAVVLALTGCFAAAGQPAVSPSLTSASSANPDYTGDSSTGDRAWTAADRANDSRNRAGWQVSFSSVGPLRVGMSVSELAKKGVARLSESEDCPTWITTTSRFGRSLVFVLQPGDRDGHDVVGLIQARGAFKTVDGIGEGSSFSTVHQRYGDRLEWYGTTYDGTQAAVIEGDNFILFLRNRRMSTVAAILVGVVGDDGRPLVPFEEC